MNSRCCARCKTPYNCGNPGCACHAQANAAAAWAATLAENHPARTDMRFHMDQYRGNRDPNSVLHGLEYERHRKE
jgi:hypothetical protein